MKAEKTSLSVLPRTRQVSPTPDTAPRRKGYPLLLASLVLFYALYCIARVVAPYTYFFHGPSREKRSSPCAQADVLQPQSNAELWAQLGDTFGTQAFKLRAVDWLAGAVRIPTESYDDIGPVGEDDRWNVFDSFHDYLSKAFPRVHASLELTKVNTYGLLYVWNGSDPSLKPVLLAAHQDVVPVDPQTLDKWEHGPYTGHYDGTYIWGRGSADDKSGLIGILSTAESLLEKGFRPTRSLVFAFGFDEEISGLHGARFLAQALLNKFGEDGFAFIIDEGGGFNEQYGTVVATPGIAEKGHLDVRIQVTAPGGHSSIPPRHTSIGILSHLIVQMELHPFKARLSRQDPPYRTMQCLAEHGKAVPFGFRRLIRYSTWSNKALRILERSLFRNPTYKSLVGTTQAADLIQGGVKVNALPEEAYAVVNHRISIHSSVMETMQHDATVLHHLAHRFNLTYNAFGTRFSTDDAATASGTLTLSDAFGTALEPAPVTPTNEDAAPYQLLAGTIKATYNAHRSLSGKDTVVVAPGMPGGNTDTKYYWKLSKHIFRYNHKNAGNATGGLMGGVHTVNEHIASDTFVEMIRFFTTLVLNADESKAL